MFTYIRGNRPWSRGRRCPTLFGVWSVSHLLNPRRSWLQIPSCVVPWTAPAPHSAAVSSPRVLVKPALLPWLFPVRGNLVVSFSPYIPSKQKHKPWKPTVAQDTGPPCYITENIYFSPGYLAVASGRRVPPSLYKTPQGSIFGFPYLFIRFIVFVYTFFDTFATQLLALVRHLERSHHISLRF